jgi:outer membrane protein OmpA-like peptidoglycan-associated protein
MPGPPPLPPEAPPTVSTPPELAPPVVTSTQPPPAVTATGAPVEPSAPVVVSEREVPGPEATPATAGMRVGDPRAARLTSSYFGPVGVYNVESAEAGEPLVLRFGLYGSYSNKSDFPVVDANTEQEIGVLTLGFSPLRFLDIYAGTRVSATNSTGTAGTNPSFISELGDFWGGVKFGGYVAKVLALGIDLRGEGYSGVGTTGLGAGAFVPTGIVTFDFLKSSKVPLRLHLNFGGQFGNLNALAPTNAAGTTIPLRAPEQFALGWTNYNQLRGGAAIELPFPYVTPFGEYTIIYPINAQNLYDPAGNPVSVGSTLPQQLDFGLRVTALRDVSFLGGGSFTMQQNVSVGVPIVPFWTVFGGITMNVDLAPHGPTRILETRTTETAVAQANVRGTVFEAETKAPIAGAIVQSSIADQGPVATNALGQFTAYPIPAGPVDFTITKDGYKAATAHAVIQAGVPTASVDVPLEREAKQIVLHVNVHGAHGRVLAANVNFTGPQAFQKDLVVPSTGSGDIALPSPGRYELRITSKGHLAQEHHLDVNLGQNTFDIVLLPEPAKSSLIIKGKNILLKKQIHFQGGSAKILPDSSTILAEIASYLIIHNVEKVRVEGFTDNTGGKARNLKLSQDRADAVMQHLIDQGFPAEKLEAVGYGDQKPVAPNLTARGRALNRRVEFLILQ